MEKPFASYRGKDPYVFICYSHENAESVYPELVWLRDAGVNVWYDEGIPAGHEWPEELAKGIGGAMAVLFFVTPQATFSKHCRSEVSYALSHDVAIVAVHLEETSLGGGLELQLGHVQALMRYELSEDDYRSKVLDALDVNPVVGTPDVQPPSSRPKPARIRVLAVVALVVTVAIVAVAFFVLRSSYTEESVAELTELTAQIGESRLPVQLTAYLAAQSLTDAKISPDGNYLAFIAAGGLYLQTIATRDVHEVQLEWAGRLNSVVWSEDGSRFYLLDSNRGLWSVSQFGGKPQLIDGMAEKAAVSPDGKHLAVIRPDEFGRSRSRVWVMASGGTEARQLLTTTENDSFWQIEWTPDSKRIALGVWGSDSSSAIGVRIDTVALDGSDRTTLLSGDELFQDFTGVLPFAWCSDGRFVFGRRDGPTHQVTSNVWIAQTNDVHKVLETNPKRLTHWVASSVRMLSADTECSRVVVMRATNQLDIFVAEYADAQISDLRQVTFDERQDYPEDWNSAGDSLLLESSRRGTWDIFEQALDRETPVVLLSTAGEQTSPAYAMGGDWIVYLDGDSEGGRINRIPRQGGAPVELLGDRYQRVECAIKGSDCVAGTTQGTEYVFTTFNVLTGDPHELIRVEHRQPFTGWDLSPDGTHVAVVHNDNNEIKVVDLASGDDQIVIVPGWQQFEFITWVHDGSGFVVNASPGDEGIVSRSSAGLIHVDFGGNPTVLRLRPNEWDVYPVMAPDGRHLAFSTMKFHANAWLIENP